MYQLRAVNNRRIVLYRIFSYMQRDATLITSSLSVRISRAPLCEWQATDDHSNNKGKIEVGYFACCFHDISYHARCDVTDLSRIWRCANRELSFQWTTNLDEADSIHKFESYIMSVNVFYLL
jgi:hypothetical protein